MDYVLKERIDKPGLFTGRKEKPGKKIKALVKGDIIEQDVSNYRYRAPGDNIFDKVFPGIYQDEIEHFDVGDIKEEYALSFEKLNQQYRSLQGKYNSREGYSK